MVYSGVIAMLVLDKSLGVAAEYNLKHFSAKCVDKVFFMCDMSINKITVTDRSPIKISVADILLPTNLWQQV